MMAATKRQKRLANNLSIPNFISQSDSSCLVEEYELQLIPSHNQQNYNDDVEESAESESTFQSSVQQLDHSLSDSLGTESLLSPVSMVNSTPVSVNDAFKVNQVTFENSGSSHSDEGISSSEVAVSDGTGNSSSSQVVAQPLGLGTHDFGKTKDSLFNNELSDDDRYKVLCNLYQSLQYNFPDNADSKQIQLFQTTQFSKCSWLTYSRLATGGNHSVLVRTPLVKFRKTLAYEKTDYHKQARIAHESFLKSVSGSHESIAVQLDTAYKARKANNKKSIMATVEVCGCQGIALRGHRDDAKYLDDGSGNSQSLLNFYCTSGDSILSEHFETCGRNSTYCSKMTQNEIIDILGNMISKQII